MGFVQVLTKTKTCAVTLGFFTPISSKYIDTHLEEKACSCLGNKSAKQKASDIKENQKYI